MAQKYDNESSNARSKIDKLVKQGHRLNMRTASPQYLESVQRHGSRSEKLKAANEVARRS